MKIEFPEDLVLGVDEIDEHHRRIFQVTDQMLEAMKTGEGEKRLFSLLAYLNQYVRDHFALEENYMIRFRYDQYRPHLAQHQQFTKKFLDLQQHFKRGGPTLNLVHQVARFLDQWLKDHILSTDLPMVAFLKPKLDQVRATGEKLGGK